MRWKATSASLFQKLLSVRRAWAQERAGNQGNGQARRQRTRLADDRIADVRFALRFQGRRVAKSWPTFPSSPGAQVAYHHKTPKFDVPVISIGTNWNLPMSLRTWGLPETILERTREVAAALKTACGTDCHYRHARVAY
jgi:hypothetical protein